MTLAAAFKLRRVASKPDMRGWTLLLVLAVAALAGCTSGLDAAKKATTPTVSPTNVTTTTPPTNGSVNSTTPPPPPPAVPYATKQSHAYAGAPEVQSFVVPANAAPAKILLRISPDTAACISVDASIELRSPKGDVVASLKMPPPPPPASGDACPAPVTLDRVALLPGKWTANFAGTGSAVGAVEVTPAGGL